MSQASLCAQGTARPNKYKYGKVRVWSTQRFIAQGSKENQGEGFMPPKTLNFQRILCMPAKSLQSCLTLCDLMDSSPPGSSVHGISQARTLEWIAISFSRGSSRPSGWTWVSYIGRWVLYHWATRAEQRLLLILSDSQFPPRGREVTEYLCYQVVVRIGKITG